MGQSLLILEEHLVAGEVGQFWVHMKKKQDGTMFIIPLEIPNRSKYEYRKLYIFHRTVKHAFQKKNCMNSHKTDNMKVRKQKMSENPVQKHRNV